MKLFAVEKPHVRALKGQLGPYDCGACGHPIRHHLDTSGCYQLGCEHAKNVRRDPVLRLLYEATASRSTHDPDAVLTRALYRCLLLDCGEPLRQFLATYRGDDLLMVARALSRTAQAVKP